MIGSIDVGGGIGGNRPIIIMPPEGIDYQIEYDSDFQTAPTVLNLTSENSGYYLNRDRGDFLHDIVNLFKAQPIHNIDIKVYNNLDNISNLFSNNNAFYTDADQRPRNIMSLHINTIDNLKNGYEAFFNYFNYLYINDITNIQGNNESTLNFKNMFALCRNLTIENIYNINIQDYYESMPILQTFNIGDTNGTNLFHCNINNIDNVTLKNLSSIHNFMRGIATNNKGWTINSCKNILIDNIMYGNNSFSNCNFVFIGDNIQISNINMAINMFEGANMPVLLNNIRDIEDASGMFMQVHNLLGLENIYNINNAFHMFYRINNCNNVKDIYNIKSAIDTFNYCENIINVSNIHDISNATSMFDYCRNIINVSNIHDINICSSMFNQGRNIQFINGIYNIKSGTAMFQNANNIIKISNIFNVNFGSIFTHNYTNLKIIEDIHDITNTSNTIVLFGTSEAKPSFQLLNNIYNITDLIYLFSNTYSWSNQAIFSNFYNIDKMINSFSQIHNQRTASGPKLVRDFYDINNAYYTFAAGGNIKQVYNIHNINSAYFMFAFTGVINIENIYNINNASGMFFNCVDLINVKNIYNIDICYVMFDNCINLSTIDTNLLHDLNNARSMFENTKSLMNIPFLYNINNAFQMFKSSGIKKIETVYNLANSFETFAECTNLTDINNIHDFEYHNSFMSVAVKNMTNIYNLIMGNKGVNCAFINSQRLENLGYMHDINNIKAGCFFWNTPYYTCFKNTVHIHNIYNIDNLTNLLNPHSNLYANIKNGIVENIYNIEDIHGCFVSLVNVDVTNIYNISIATQAFQSANLNNITNIYNINNATSMFYGSTLKNVNSIYNINNATSMFEASSISEIHDLHDINITSNIFNRSTIQKLVNFYNIVNADYTFGANISYYPTNIIEIDGLSNIKSLKYFFVHAPVLTNLSNLNFDNTITMNHFFDFRRVPKLTIQSFDNIALALPNCNQVTDCTSILDVGFSQDQVNNLPHTTIDIVINNGWSVPILENYYISYTNISKPTTFITNTNISRNIDIDVLRNGELIRQFFTNIGINTIVNINLNLTHQIRDFSNMFANYTNLKYLQSLDTKNIENTAYMFCNDENLISIPKLDTANLINSASMFENCKKITSTLDINISRSENASKMFYQCSSLPTVLNLDMTMVTNAEYMFAHCSNLSTLELLHTSKLLNISGMFMNTPLLNTITNIDTSNIIDMSSAFRQTGIIETLNIDYSKVQKLYFTYTSCKNLLKVSSFNAPNAINAQRMFCFDNQLAQVELFNMPNVTDMDSMFYGCENLRVDAMENIINSLPNYNQITVPTSEFNGLGYIGLTQNQIDRLPASANAIAIEKGWALTSNIF